MKPNDVLPGTVDSVEREGVVIRKGTFGAFTENIRIMEDKDTSPQKCKEAAADLLLLVPALVKLRFFEFYLIKSTKARNLIKERFPDLPVER